jgi:DNA-binding NarL/FixJ family response regulator
MAVRIVIADDHEPVRRSIKLLLGRKEGWSICGEAADGLEVTELARQLHPDVVLMDMSMPHMDGIDAARISRSELPEIKVQALGCLVKSAMAYELIPAILNVTEGLDADPIVIGGA